MEIIWNSCNFLNPKRITMFSRLVTCLWTELNRSLQIPLRIPSKPTWQSFLQALIENNNKNKQGRRWWLKDDRRRKGRKRAPEEGGLSHRARARERAKTKEIGIEGEGAGLSFKVMLIQKLQMPPYDLIKILASPPWKQK